MRSFVRFLSISLIFVLVLGVVGVQAQSAKNASWVVSVTYQNVGTGPATINVNFYPEGDGNPISFDPLSIVDGETTLAAGAGKSFYIGRVSGLADGFNGSAVVSSTQPLVVSVVQFSNDSGVNMRLLSNGFDSDAASSQYLIATALLNKFNRTTVFSIQNTEAEPIVATVKLYDADDNGNLASTKDFTIPGGSTKYIDMSNPADTGLSASTTVFNGSAIVTAVLSSDGSTPGKVVAAANEYYTNRPVAASFEGIPLAQAASTIYMGTGVCENFNLDTYYAVQNASLTDNAFVEVVYRDTTGAVVATDGRYEIGPGQKVSIKTCEPSDGTNMAGFSGSAVINSYDADTGTTAGAPIVAIGKAQNSINAGSADKADVFTAFLGQSAGSSKVALPYVRWATDADFSSTSDGSRQRSFLAIQNLENSEIKVVVSYRDKDGNETGSQTLTIPAYAKANSNANSAGALTDGQFGYYGTPVTSYGGAVVITAHPDNPSAKFLAINRTQHSGAGEDYNAIDIE